MSDHPFALEHFRWSSTRNGIKRLKVDRDDRPCRLCGRDVQSPEHALLVCSGVPELVDARDRFVAQVRTRCPDLVQQLSTDDAVTVLVALLAYKKEGRKAPKTQIETARRRMRGAKEE